MTGAMIALYIISAIIGLCILVWFIITLNGIRSGIDDIGESLRKIAWKEEQPTDADASKLTEDEKKIVQEFRKQKKEDRIAKAFPREEENNGLLNSSEKAKLKTAESSNGIKVFAVTRRETENGRKKTYRLDLQTSPDGTEPAMVFKAEINPDQFTKLEPDRKYTREELEL